MKIQQNCILLHISQTIKLNSAWILSIPHLHRCDLWDKNIHQKHLIFYLSHEQLYVSVVFFSWDGVASANPCYVLPWILCTDVMWGMLFSYASLLSGDDLVRGNAEREPHQLSLPGCGVPRKYRPASHLPPSQAWVWKCLSSVSLEWSSAKP